MFMVCGGGDDVGIVFGILKLQVCFINVVLVGLNFDYYLNVKVDQLGVVYKGVMCYYDIDLGMQIVSYDVLGMILIVVF